MIRLQRHGHLAINKSGLKRQDKVTILLLRFDMICLQRHGHSTINKSELKRQDK